jgi:hypothetical protein
MIEIRDEPTATPRLLRRVVSRLLFVVGAVAFVAFWTWALFFASKEAVNRVGDRAWAERAQAVCVTADGERLKLADFRELENATPEMIRERASIVDQATDVLEGMLDDVVATLPTDAKGREIVPLWEAEYRTYIGDRRAFADRLRASGENEAFYETEVELPISERLETFAGDNDMPACAPPRDLTR